MKNFTLIIFAIFSFSTTYAQVGINADNSAPHISAQLDVKSTTKAFYPPRMTTAQKNAIGSVQPGATVFDITLNQLSFYNGSAWVAAAGGGLLTLPYNQTQSAATPALEGLFNITNTFNNDDGNAINGSTYSKTGFGIVGKNFSNSADGGGVFGYSFLDGAGVVGISNNGKGISGIADTGIGGHFNSNTGYALITENGNVGIGTTTPNLGGLVVDKKVGAVNAVFGSNTTGVSIESDYPGIGLNTYYNNGRKMINTGFGGLFGLNPFNGSINFYNTATSLTGKDTPAPLNARLTILANGNVGISNETPQEKLHITAGNIRVDALASNGYNQLYTNPQGNIQNLAPVAFLVKSIVNNINIPISDDFLVPFNTVEYNLGSFYNTTNYEFTAPLNGIYHFDAFVTFGSVGSVTQFSEYSLSIFKNNQVYSTVNNPMVKEVYAWKTMNISQDINLTVGQKVKIVAKQTSSTVVSFIGGDLSTKFSGHLVMRL